MEDEDRYTRITLRLPKELHQALSTAADETSKSLNAEIVSRLQASLSDGPLQAWFVAELQAQIAKLRAELVRQQLESAELGHGTLVIHRAWTHPEETDSYPSIKDEIAAILVEANAAVEKAKEVQLDEVIEKLKSTFENTKVLWEDVQRRSLGTDQPVTGEHSTSHNPLGGRSNRHGPSK